MEKTICRVFALALLAALVPFADCAAPETAGQVPAPVSKEASALNETAAAAAQGNGPLLFVIERSKNANIVRYEANFKPDGSLDPKKPVIAYWLMLAGEGSRKKLNAALGRAAGKLSLKCGPLTMQENLCPIKFP